MTENKFNEGAKRKKKKVDFVNELLQRLGAEKVSEDEIEELENLLSKKVGETRLFVLENNADLIREKERNKDTHAIIRYRRVAIDGEMRDMLFIDLRNAHAFEKIILKRLQKKGLVTFDKKTRTWIFNRDVGDDRFKILIKLMSAYIGTIFVEERVHDAVYNAITRIAIPKKEELPVVGMNEPKEEEKQVEEARELAMKEESIPNQQNKTINIGQSFIPMSPEELTKAWEQVSVEAQKALRVIEEVVKGMQALSKTYDRIYTPYAKDTNGRDVQMNGLKTLGAVRTPAGYEVKVPEGMEDNFEEDFKNIVGGENFVKNELNGDIFKQISSSIEGENKKEEKEPEAGA